MNIFSLLLIATGVAVFLQVLLWGHATRSRNAGWVDLGWSGGMVLAAVLLAVLSPPSARLYAVSLLVGCWGLRLALHIYVDRLRGGKTEDARYTNLRNHWGEKADRNFFFFFQAQALLVGLFLIPAAVVSRRAGPFPDVWDIAGLWVAGIAVLGESVADRQLAGFRADPSNKGLVCSQGLWRYSRHPNYFFEWIHWFAYVLMGRGDVWTWTGPVLMYLFLRYLTGIPHVEKQSLRSRGEAYRIYQNTTSAFFPWIPRKPS